LNLLLSAHDLTFVQDDKGLVVTARKAAPAAPAKLSEPQRICAKRIEAMLDGKLSFNLQDKKLAEVCQYFEETTQENFVLDPVARRAGQLDPTTTVSGSVQDVPLREGLEKLLGPLGLKAVVRDEVVVITPRTK
jgi:hypothetical protein